MVQKRCRRQTLFMTTQPFQKIWLITAKTNMRVEGMYCIELKDWYQMNQKTRNGKLKNQPHLQVRGQFRFFRWYSRRNRARARWEVLSTYCLVAASWSLSPP